MNREGKAGWRALNSRGQQGLFAILGPAVILLVSLWNTSAARQAPKQAAPAPTDPTIARGRAQFQQTCGFCHGPDATGGRAPDLIRSPLLAHDVKGDKIGEVVRSGRPDKGMPALSLTQDQIEDIAAFLHSRLEEGLRSSRVPTEYALEKLLTGNAEAGKTFFNGAGGCSGCHSPTGDLAGIATKYTPIDLQAKMLYPGGKHTTAIVTLANGEQIKGPLVHIDDFMISLHDASGWYRSFPRDKVKAEIQDGLAGHRELLSKLTQADVRNVFAYLESLK
jgi:cytochrome c oxidase cbb3-type subunit III